MSRTIRIGLLDPCRFQQAHHYDEANITAIHQDLTDKEGSREIINPIHIVPKGAGRFEIIAGHDRYEASKRAGKTEIPARDFGSVVLSAEQVYEHWRRDNAIRKTFDKRLAVEETLLEFAGKWSDRRVAACCGCAHPLVGEIRRGLIATRRLEDSSKRVSSDGVERTVKTGHKSGTPRPRKTGGGETQADVDAGKAEIVRERAARASAPPAAPPTPRRPSEQAPETSVSSEVVDSEDLIRGGESETGAPVGVEALITESVSKDSGSNLNNAVVEVLAVAPWVEGALTLTALPLTDAQARAMSDAQIARLEAFGLLCQTAAKRARTVQQRSVVAA